LYALNVEKLILLTIFFKFLLENNLKNSGKETKINYDLFLNFFSSEKENNVQKKISESIDVSKKEFKDSEKISKKNVKKKRFPLNKNLIEGNVEMFQNILKKVKNIKSEDDLCLICEEILLINQISCNDIELLNNVHHYLKENKKIVNNLNSKPDFKLKLSKCLKKITNRVGILNRKK
jgi:F0F1-type ATP synthase alpha subunit